MPKFKKKPVIVDVEQFFVDKKPWPKGVIDMDAWADSNGVIREKGLSKYGIFLDGGVSLLVDAGDWVFRDDDGIYHARKPGIFEQTYEAVE